MFLVVNYLLIVKVPGEVLSQASFSLHIDSTKVTDLLTLIRYNEHLLFQSYLDLSFLIKFNYHIFEGKSCFFVLVSYDGYRHSLI